MFDRVRIKQSPETEAAEVAGLEGDVYGFTTPSVTMVDVIGGAPDDVAINVNIDSRGTALWFRPDLVEVLHHNAGAKFEVGNVTAVRQPDGSWVETIKGSPAAAHTVAAMKPLSLWQRLLGLFKK